MTCAQAEREDWLARYVARELDEAAEEAFEVHLLGCPHCASALEVLADTRDALRGARRVRTRTMAWAMPLAAVTLLAVGIGVLRRLGPPGVAPAPSSSTARATAAPSAPQGTQPAAAPTPDAPLRETLARLAAVEAPEYLALTARGAAATPFDEAMRHYAAGRYTEAARALAALPEHDERSGFFQGVSLLLAGRASDARAVLAAVAQGGDPEYAPAARFFLAKALLRANRVPEARSELEQVARDGGAYAQVARELLGRLSRLAAE